MSTQKILNPFIWKDNILRQEVKDALDNIVVQFIDELETNNIPIEIVDVHIVGSNASYNYDLNSDLDVHVVADFSNINCNEKVLELLYNFFKSYFNNKYDISVHGIKVELYIENQKTPAKSNGIYSLVDDEWIKFPEQTDAIEVNIEQELSYWLEEYNKVIAASNIELLQDFLNKLYILRRDSLINDGEYGKGNLVFKYFRNNGYINTIKDLLAQNISQSLTLESVSEMLEEEHASYERALSLQENVGFGYHYGDLGKAEYKHNFGNRSTGGFGTGIYFIGKPISQLKYKSSYSDRPEHKIDLEKYNLYTPKSNELAYLLHDALVRINNEAANGAKKLIRVDEVLDEYEKMLDTYFQDYMNVQEIAAKQYVDKYKDIVDDSYSDEELIEQARYIRDILLDTAHKDEQILRDLSRALGIYDKDKLTDIVDKALQDTSDIAPSTLIMKQLGYDGVDVRHLNKDADGLAGLDNFSYGSVIYDLKEAHQDQTVYTAISRYEDFVYKYGKNSALFELKYKYHLTDEELVYIINRLAKKGLMDEYTKAYNINTLGLEEYFK